MHAQTYTYKESNKLIDIYIYMKTDRYTWKQTDRQIHRDTDRQTHKQAVR